jgi:hypothetical protein
MNATTMLQVEWWQLLTFAVGLLTAFLGAVWAGAVLFIKQSEVRIAERFTVVDNTQRQAFGQLQKQIETQVQADNRLLDRIPELERDLLKFQAELPKEYVRREDYIRGQTVIEAKLDALAMRIENARLSRGSV